MTNEFGSGVNISAGAQCSEQILLFYTVHSTRRLVWSSKTTTVSRQVSIYSMAPASLRSFSKSPVACNLAVSSPPPMHFPPMNTWGTLRAPAFAAMADCKAAPSSRVSSSTIVMFLLRPLNVLRAFLALVPVGEIVRCGSGRHRIASMNSPVWATTRDHVPQKSTEYMFQSNITSTIALRLAYT